MTSPRRLWTHLWQLSLAGLISLLAGVLTWAAIIDEAPEPSPPMVLLLLLDMFLGLVCLVLVGLRRTASVTFTVVICAAFGLSVFSAGAWLLAVASLSTRRDLRLTGLMFAVTATGAALGELLTHAAGGQGTIGDQGGLAVLLLGVPVLFALPVLSGWFVGSRRALLQSLRNEARAAQAEQEAAAARARAEERNRISREIHDEVGHRLSLIALHAGALEYRDDLSEDQVREEAGVIRSSARRAMNEVRQTLHLLRRNAEDGTGAGTSQDSAEPSPAPLPDRLHHLTDEVTAAGSPVSINVDAGLEAALEQLPASAARHVYRIAQETLTNALRHAPAAPVELSISGHPGERLELTVSNPLSPQTDDDGGSGGLGLVGARERAQLAGGELVIEATGGSFRVRAWVPWPS